MDLFISQGFANIGCDILQYLDNQSLCQSRLVCTNWARFITCERFWHRRIIKVRIFQKVFLVRSLYIVSCLPKMNQTTVQKTNLLYGNTEFVLFKFYDNEHIKNGPINTIYFQKKVDFKISKNLSLIKIIHGIKYCCNQK